jgi:hypothetical protein
VSGRRSSSAGGGGEKLRPRGEAPAAGVRSCVEVLAGVRPGVEKLRRRREFWCGGAPESMGRSAGRRGLVGVGFLFGPDGFLGDIFGAQVDGEWQYARNNFKGHVQTQITLRSRGRKPREATGSTSRGAFPSLPIRLAGFGEARSAATPFGWFAWLFSLESHRKPKQTPPYRGAIWDQMLLVIRNRWICLISHD